MNHGYCKDCWWWKRNWCYFHESKAIDMSYCPDYKNRKRVPKREGTLDEWIKKNKL